MRIEKQVCTLEQARAFFELLGEDAPSNYFMWAYEVDQFGNNPRYAVIEKHILDDDLSYYPPTPEYPAYTGDELGALLPKIIMYEDEKLYLQSFVHSYDHSWIFGYAKHDDPITKMIIEEYNQIEARAKAALAIQGLKDGWIKKEEFRYQEEK